MGRIRRAVACVLLGLAAASPPLFAQPQAAGRMLVADGIEVHYGFIPAAITRRHPAGHPERPMHGGTAGTAEEEHLVVALFDAATKQRIENAEVKATVGPAGPHAQAKPLEPMRIADTASYGNYFAPPATGRYRIDLQIRVPGRVQAVSARFVYERR